MGKEFQKSALPTLFHFVRVKAAFQPHVFQDYFQVLNEFQMKSAESMQSLKNKTEAGKVNQKYFYQGYTLELEFKS